MNQSAETPVFNPMDPNRWDADIELPERRSNWDVTFQHRIEAGIISGLFWVFQKLGLDRSSAFMGGFLRRVGPLLWPVQKRGLSNLALVYPENTRDQNKKILADVWENLGRTVAEYAHLPELYAASETPRIRVKNPEMLERLVAEQEAYVFVSAHIANWELMAGTLYRAGLKCAAVYRAANNPIIDEKIINLRAAVMSRYLIPKNKKSSRSLLRAVGSGMSLCMLVDQKLNEGIRVPFLGHPANTALSTARIAQKFKTKIVPLSLKRLGHSAQFELEILDAIDPCDDQGVPLSAELLTVYTNDALSTIILDNPTQWLWFHRRWPKDVMPQSA